LAGEFIYLVHECLVHCGNGETTGHANASPVRRPPSQSVVLWEADNVALETAHKTVLVSLRWMTLGSFRPAVTQQNRY